MDTLFIKDFFNALRAELIKFRTSVVLSFLVIVFLILFLGMLLPKKYTTSVILYVEQTKIIEPLLKGNAEVTKIDRSEQASEVIYTRANLLAAAKISGLITEKTPSTDQERIIRYIRDNIVIKRERNNNQFKVSYTTNNQDESFDVLNAIVNTFIESTSRKKQEESMGAYNFIDDQVQNYKKQLESAEQRLKEFKSRNTDGTEMSVTERISNLRQEIETLKISVDEATARVKSLEVQLNTEGRYLQAKSQVDDLRAKKLIMADNLEKLRLNYQESYPDIIVLRSQIAEVDDAINKLNSQGRAYSNSDRVENPLYEELRRQFSDAEVDLRMKTRRIESLEALLQQEYARQERIASNQAELSELTRDYTVTKKMYDVLVERKEAARISMSLDVEGQGVSYRIREPASFPLNPVGLRFEHLAILGPILGFLIVLGVLILYIFVDPRIRSTRSLLNHLPQDVEFAGAIPHYKSPLAERLLRKDVMALYLLIIVALVLYVGVAFGWQKFYGA